MSNSSEIDMKALYSRAVTASPESIWCFNKEGRILWANEATTRSTGYSLEELRQLHVCDVEQAIPTEHRANLLEHAAEHGSRRIAGVHRRKDGSTYPVEVVVAKFDYEGEPYGCAIMHDVSSRHRDKQALSMREQAIRASQEAIAFAGLDERITYVNPAFVRMWGYDSAQQILGRPPWEFWTDSDNAIRQLKTVREEGHLTGEMVAKRKDGSTFIARHATSTVTDRDGMPLCVMMLISDVTEQKNAVEALRRSESRFRSIVESIPLGLHMYERNEKGELVLVDTNPASDQLLHINTNDLLGKPIEAAFPGLTDTGIPQRYCEVLETGVPFHTEQFFYHDERIAGAFDIYAFKADEIHVTALFADITERVLERQSERGRAQRIQRQQAAILRVATDAAVASGNLPEGLHSITSAAVEALGIDRASLWFLNKEGDELICRDEFDTEQVTEPSLKSIHSGECHTYFAAVLSGSIIDGHDARNDPRTRELRLSHLEPLEITSTIEAPFHMAGQVAGVLRLEHRGPVRQWQTDELAFAGQVADHTSRALLNAERKNEEVHRRELQEQVAQAQKLESLGILAGGIAHDFNNLLMTILGNADLALQDVGNAHPVRSSLLEIERASQRAAELCRQMLAYSGRGSLVQASVDLNSMVSEMKTLLRASISKRATLQLALADGLPPVHGDPTQLRQVVMNLITNASDALGEEDGLILVETGIADHAPKQPKLLKRNENSDGQFVYVQVSDTGCGMDDTIQQRIFEPFFSTKFTGRGLGLAAAQGIVRGHDGSIELSSELGKGTTFRVLLPAENAASEGSTEAPTREASWSGAGVVLLADDEPTVRKVAKRMIERCGFDVIVANDGQQAVDLFCAHQDELRGVILDLTMPVKDGTQALAEIRALNTNIPILISSGYSEQELEQRVTGLDSTGFIHKPYRTQTLQNALREAFRSTTDSADTQ